MLYTVYSWYTDFCGFVDSIKSQKSNFNEYLSLLNACTDHSKGTTNLHIREHKSFTQSINQSIIFILNNHLQRYREDIDIQ
jgi:hypothetical protein